MHYMYSFIHATAIHVLLATSKPKPPHIFKGKHKWLGGAVNPVDGSIFGIPSNTDSIIRIIPNSYDDVKNDNNECVVEQIELPSNIRRGRYKWLRGIIVHGHLYGIPAWSKDGVLKVPILDLMENESSSLSSSSSPSSQKVSAIVGIPTVIPLPQAQYNLNYEDDKYNDNNGTSDDDFRKDRWMWHGAALSEDNKYIYCIPSNADRVLKVNVQEEPNNVNNEVSVNAIEEIGPKFHGQNKWYGGIRGLDGCIYCAPYTAGGILRINPKDDSVSIHGEFGLSEWKWHGGVLCENGAIFCFPSHSSYALRINTAPRKDDDQLFSLVSIPETNDSVQKYKWLGGAIGVDGAVYAMPCDTNSVLRIDPGTNETRLIGVTPGGKNKWQGGVLGPDGFIYAVPADASTILKIDTRPPFDSKSNNDWRVTCMGSLPPTRKKWQGGFIANDQIYAVSNSLKIYFAIY